MKYKSPQIRIGAIFSYSRPVSRILSSDISRFTRIANSSSFLPCLIAAWVIIYLGHTSRRASCSLPGTAILYKGSGDEQPPLCLQTEIVPAWPCSRWGLPGRECYHPRRWSLTLPTTSSSIKRMLRILPPFHPCRHFQTPFDVWKCLGGLFLWPDPEDFSPPDVIRHLALRSADFPQLCNHTAAITRSTRGKYIILAN